MKMIIIENTLEITTYILENGKLLKLEIEISILIKNSNPADKNSAIGK